ncbi:Uncharacterised protein [Chlamydia trachomatis]|nr:Uncharacterised protein [Chlamydia trachomatis]
MIEDGVENDANPVTVGGVDEGGEGGFVSESRVDGEVVLGIVAMVGVGFEDRREVEGVDAELDEMIELARDTREIPSEEVVPGRLAPPGNDSLRIEGVVAIGEAFREDLIEDGIMKPIGGVHVTPSFLRRRCRG